MRRIGLLAVLTLMVLSATSAFARTLTVGPSRGDFRTIQAAIDASVNGDTIVVRSGIYKGDGNRQLQLKGKAIRVKSSDGPDRCTIDCEGQGSGFVFMSSQETKQSIVSGFTVTHAGNSGIQVQNASPTILDCILTENTGRSGGGIYLLNSSAILMNCVISNNQVAKGGGGVDNFAMNGAVPTLKNCTIVGNRAGESNSACGVRTITPIVITNSILWGNSGGSSFKEVDFTYGEKVDVTYSDTGNVVIEGEGNINADPLFLGPTRGDYRLTDGSPCIDAGKALDSNLPPKDLAGNPRVVHSTVDMGAYEFQK